MVAVHQIRLLNQSEILPMIEQLLRSDNKSADSKLKIWRSFLTDIKDTIDAIQRVG
jgi:hypothetical protein